MTAALTMAGPVGQAVPMGEVPDPQVPEKAKRRTYTAKYKRDILAEYEACDRDGQITTRDRRIQTPTTPSFVKSLFSFGSTSRAR